MIDHSEFLDRCDYEYKRRTAARETTRKLWVELTYHANLEDMELRGMPAWPGHWELANHDGRIITCGTQAEIITALMRRGTYTEQMEEHRQQPA